MEGSILRGHFKTLHDRVVVEVPKAKETVSKGGIIIPAGRDPDEGNFAQPIEGRIVAVGAGVWCSRGKKKWFHKTTSKVGQRVIFNRHSGETIPTVHGDEFVYFHIHDDEVIAVIDGDDPEIKTLSNQAEVAA
jgi:co-chaperonin GroES (HSP10)